MWARRYNCNSSGRAAVTSQIPPRRKVELSSNPEKRVVNLKRKIPDESGVDVCPRKMARFAPVGFKFKSGLKNKLRSKKTKRVKKFTRSQTRTTYQPPNTVEQQTKQRIRNYWRPSLETIQELDEEVLTNDESRRSSIRIDMPRCKDSNSFQNSTAKKFFWGSLVVFLIIMIVSFTILPHFIGLSRNGLAEKQALAEKSISTFTSYTTNQKTAEEKNNTIYEIEV